MSTDRDVRFTLGYDAARSFYLGQLAATENVARTWADPGRVKVRGLIRKHWPELAERLDRLEVGL